MSSAIYEIREHLVPAQHIRQYPHATLGSQEDVLHLAVKQYTPRDNLDPSPGDLTIIAAHANAFPKVSGSCSQRMFSTSSSSRNYMNPYGMSCILQPNPLGLKSGIYG
jgi:hypothetical protein